MLQEKQQASERRSNILLNHLFPTTNVKQQSDISRSITIEQHLTSGSINNNSIVDQQDLLLANELSKEMYRYQKGHHFQIENKIFKFVEENKEIFKPKFNLTKEKEREIAQKQLELIIHNIKPFEMQDFIKDPRKFITTLESFHYIDFTLAGRTFIHFGLFASCLLFFGTNQKHFSFLQRVVKDFGKGKFFGMFCMTEVNHGSNVNGIETKAIYKQESKTFHIITPHDGAAKAWIGGAADTATYAVVWAQLYVDSKCYGVHCFLVPIRTEKDFTLVEGVKIRDMGSKISLNGLDNGRVWFDIEIPKDNLLDKFGTVNENGKYVSSIENIGDRLLAHVQGLLIGRITCAVSALVCMKVSIEIGLTYSMKRKQFGPTLNHEVPVINYLGQRRRLYPYLGMIFVLHFAVEDLKNKFEFKSVDTKYLHTLAGCLKAKSSKTAVTCCQEVREAMGGQGFLAANRIGEMRSVADASCTYEGDNFVLFITSARQLVARKNSYPKNLDNLTNVFDLSLLSKLFEYREYHLENKYREKLQYLTKNEGLNPFDATVKSQDLAFKLGNAFIESEMIKTFIKEAIQHTNNKNLQSIYEKLGLLVVITWIQQDGFFLQHQLINSNQYDQLDQKLNGLCDELTPILPTLFQAFHIPSFAKQVPVMNLEKEMAYDKIYE
ncbi:hypothetical protein ABK040_006845 [Willaertia magna]